MWKNHYGMKDKINNLSEENIRYDLTESLPSDWENCTEYYIQKFIKNNLNDCKIINGI